MDALSFKQEMLSLTCDMQKILHATFTPLCLKHGVTLQQVHVLVELNREPGLSAGQLSDRVGILRTNFSSVCRRLEERGLVERRRCASDKRAFELRATDEGRALLASIDKEMMRQYGSVFENEPQETFVTIVKGFQALDTFSSKLVY